MAEGVGVRTEEGTPQGGPLSPLLANILLDDLDKELEGRGYRFVRCADDCNIYVRTERAGLRVKESVTAFLKKRLRLRGKEAKSTVARPWRRTFLGFPSCPDLPRRGEDPRIRLAPETVRRVKARLRELRRRSRSRAMDKRLGAVNLYLRGWAGYFALAGTPSAFEEVDEWLRHRPRACVWKQWKRVRTRRRELRTLGLPGWLARPLANSRKGPWRMSGGPMNRALGTAYWRAQGLLALSDLYHWIS